MAALKLVCPAALPIHPATDEPSVVCGVLEQANEGAEIGGWEERGQITARLSGSRDRSTVRNLCAGRGVPGSAVSYCSCVLWQAQKEAEWAQRHGPDALRDPIADRPPAVRDRIDAPAVGSLVGGYDEQLAQLGIG